MKQEAKQHQNISSTQQWTRLFHASCVLATGALFLSFGFVAPNPVLADDGPKKTITVNGQEIPIDDSGAVSQVRLSTIHEHAAPVINPAPPVPGGQYIGAPWWVHDFGLGDDGNRTATEAAAGLGALGLLALGAGAVQWKRLRDDEPPLMTGDVPVLAAGDPPNMPRANNPAGTEALPYRTDSETPPPSELKLSSPAIPDGDATHDGPPPPIPGAPQVPTICEGHPKPAAPVVYGPPAPPEPVISQAPTVYGPPAPPYLLDPKNRPDTGTTAVGPNISLSGALGPLTGDVTVGIAVMTNDHNAAHHWYDDVGIVLSQSSGLTAAKTLSGGLEASATGGLTVYDNLHGDLHNIGGTSRNLCIAAGDEAAVQVCGSVSPKDDSQSTGDAIKGALLDDDNPFSAALNVGVGGGVSVNGSESHAVVYTLGDAGRAIGDWYNSAADDPHTVTKALFTNGDEPAVLNFTVDPGPQNDLLSSQANAPVIRAVDPPASTPTLTGPHNDTTISALDGTLNDTTASAATATQNGALASTPTGPQNDTTISALDGTLNDTVPSASVGGNDAATSVSTGPQNDTVADISQNSSQAAASTETPNPNDQWPD